MKQLKLKINNCLLKNVGGIGKQQSSFTLIEATVVLFIIALLMLLILPNLNRQRERAEATHRKAMVGTVQTQIDLYLNDHPEQKSVTLADLRKEDYLTKQQEDKVKKLKIVVSGHEAKG
ncbi:Competence protein ComGC (ComGC) [Fructobacillus fructosus]|uniref:prepilin-type N-terminal cleavage/methylation domain-containing protein n=1 Tax=Fructobacillus fructosus TaxID=1631 RepID=UPI00021943A3|nr:prepilin-type N-terminal cleavage/methylation domain-containing protein [Fructobacillus fructosus]CAK1233215.1 Competence protein ComGC (ComGC) [Fructobacillus fructosus]CAK1246636.1 Competence protein ComGC (ComGC) [Fructobacillus fructosus]CAK1248193.1 Competence protein ComGC (ComGC) [Fructobacillus fructosus]CAK1248977.1 Competence protein ComGC (ComGC) [Fructobacillus fructosus]GAP01558.1 competence protein ComGC [Fructobacillus fructosus]